MNKPLLLLMAPVNTVSGYGARSRDVAQALIASDKYDVRIFPTRWGSTPQNYLNLQDEKDKLILDRCMNGDQLERKPDIFIQITVPNEFQPMGNVNIGITAGIETTVAAAPWIEGCNRMDLVLTSSEHSKKVLQNSHWQLHDQQTKQPKGLLKLEKPIEVLFEGVDADTYFKTKEIHKSVDDQLKQVKENFAFLFVGHWLKGDFGEDRKNVSAMIRTFIETFKNKSSKNQPALILKTSHSDFSPIDKAELFSKLEQLYRACEGGTHRNRLPNIYLIHGDLTNDEMNSLYNHPKVKAHVTFTKGEGYGRPLAEASLSEKIIIAPNWGGHVDFVKHSIQLPGGLTNVHESAAWDQVILKESQWFTVDYAQASAALKYAADKKHAKATSVLAKRQAKTVKDGFMFEHMCAKLEEYMEKYAKVAEPVALKLPKLEKKDELSKLKLPKLKKQEA